MADDQTQRPYRSNEPPRAQRRLNAASASDPLAELARLIGQTDPFAEFGRDNARRAAPSPRADCARLGAPTIRRRRLLRRLAAPPEAQPYGAPVTRQPHANSPYAADADLYRTENETPGLSSRAGWR